MTDWHLGDPDVSFDAAGTPQSDAFGDIYFSRAGGVAETRHVFLGGCGLPDAWAGRARFRIGETGFGTGLNFLTTWAAWKRDPARCGVLEYIAVEGFPLTAAQVRRALAPLEGVGDLAEHLAAAWPARQPGLHLLTFEGGRVRLLLGLGPVREVLAALSDSVDAWFLDGFAPARNPDMWSGAVCQRLAALSRPGTRLATFTAAGAVRRALGAAGFAVEKRPGYGRKRDSIAAVFEGEETAPFPPWFRRPAPLPAGARVAVVGGGVAGAAVAGALARAGFDPVIVERRGALAAEGSGNPCGLLKHQVIAGGGPRGRFVAAAARFARSLLPADAWVRDGVLSVARDEAEQARMAKFAALHPDDEVRLLTPAEAAARAGTATPFGGLWFAHGGAIRPPVACRALAGDVPVIAAEASVPQKTATGWRVAGLEVDAVVLAAGPLVPRLWPRADLPVRANRGQISILPACTGPEVAVTGGGYLSPPYDAAGHRVLGATYDRWPDPADPSWAEVSDGAHARNRATFAEGLPGLAARLPAPVAGRAALRAAVADHVPLMGPLFDAAVWREAYADLAQGRREAAYPPAPLEDGLYVLGALGSRGFLTAPLLAEALTAVMSGGVLPLERAFWAAVHPGRFLVRALRKGG